MAEFLCLKNCSRVIFVDKYQVWELKMDYCQWFARINYKSRLPINLIHDKNLLSFPCLVLESAVLDALACWRVSEWVSQWECFSDIVKSWTYHLNISGITCAYIRHISCTSWAYHRHKSGIYCTYLGHMWGISWAYVRHILGISSAFLGHILVVVTIGCQDCCEAYCYCLT